MTSLPTSGSRPNRSRGRIVESAALVAAFLLVHAVLWFLAVTVANLPIGDVTITYRRWVADGLASGNWVGIDSDSVYPVLALVPMIVAAAAGVAHIGTGWLALMTLLDIAVLALLWPHRVGGVRVAWWWTVFLLALGPIAIGRIDTVATALALAGVVFVARRPAVASALFTLGAWVKVWPAALVGVLLLLRRGHRRGVLVGALVVTGVVVAIDAVLGGGAHLLSFVGQQTGRGLQIESTMATAFMWRAWAHAPGAAVFYDQQILTFEVSGSGTAVVAALSTPLMALVVIGAALLALRAVHDGAVRSQVAPVLTMALTAALIAANKVGSPQYVGWFAVPIVWGLIAGSASARRFLVPALVTLVMAFLTQLIYPAYYDRVLTLDGTMLTVLTVRNALQVALLVWALVTLVRLGSGARAARQPGDGAAELSRAVGRGSRERGSMEP